MDENVNDISRAEAVANMVSGSGSTWMKTAAKAVLVRMPLHILTEVDTMAAIARKSRNLMIAELLGVGLESVRRELPDEVVDRLDERTFIELSDQVELMESGVEGDDSFFGELKG